MMTTVYRFECAKCGKGPYRCFCDGSAKLQDTLGVLHTGSSDHPVPCYHIRDYLWKGYLSGTESLDSLFEWFDTLLPELHEAGMVLAWYEVDAAHVIPICQCTEATPHVLMEPDQAISRSAMTIA